MSRQNRVSEFARHTELRVINAVRESATKRSQARQDSALKYFEDKYDPAKTWAAQVKDYALDHLADLLVEFEANCQRNGVQVHWAQSTHDARLQILSILKERVVAGAKIAKAKSMATEEIHLNNALEEAGYFPIETDLGEFVVQLDRDTPSHIVSPIIHKTRHQVADTFESHGLGPRTTEPEELTMQARRYLREAFQGAAAGISGVNFGVAESGRLVLIENEGNNRFSTTAPEIHIALMGIEKILPTDADLATFLRLLKISSTGQQITTYAHFVHGPRKADEIDGPKEIHLILLDNGRTRAHQSPERAVLRCIRCGACLNACPVYRQATGHAYGHVYPGPIGAVLAPALEGIEAQGDLAFASSLCGLCEEVCPVRIPIPDLLLSLRRKTEADEDLQWRAFADAVVSPFKWRLGMQMLPMASIAPHPLTSGWKEFHDWPERRGRDFRRWWNGRS